MKRLIYFLSLITVFCFITTYSFGQFPGCPSVDAGSDVSLDCYTPCTNLVATPFNVGATTSYTVQSIPHTPPISYTEPGGTGVSVGTDDVWSPAINLPFDFCFYGQTYNNCVIGSNGAIKFGITSASGYHPWSFTASCPSIDLIDAGNIFGIYHDIDPSVAGTVKWYLLGTAPCRIFVVVFNDLAHFSCNNLTSTHMMVLYETTNAIDVYVDHKETCTGWNSGNAVIGIQDNTGTNGITPAGRNTGSWTASTPEAWRFLPSGSPIYSVEWLEGGAVVATGNTYTACPVNTTTYTARATYTSCNGQIIVEEDDVTVTMIPGGVTVVEATNVSASCGQSDGELSVTASGGVPGYTYSIDDVTYQASSTFSNLPAGTYTVFAKDNTGCIGVVQVEIIENSTIGFDFTSVQQISCFGANDGEVTLTASNGTLPYQFSINGGSLGSAASFTGLIPGIYTFEVEDGTGCSATIDTIIIEPAQLVLNLVSSTDAGCATNDGQIEVAAVGGTSPFSYQLSTSGTPQSSGVFTAVSTGNYTLQVTDDSGCTATVVATINAPTPPVLTLVQNDPICQNATNSNLEVTVAGGLAPFTFDVNGLSPQSSPIFTTLGPGNYTINVTDGNGCADQLAVTIDAIPLPQIFSSGIGCNYQYQVENTVSFDGGIWSATDTVIIFSNPGGENPIIYTEVPGTYTVSYTDNQCNITVTAEVTFPPLAYTQVLDTIICIGSTYVINAQQNPTVSSFSWNTGAIGPSITVNGPGDYIVTASNICHTHIDTATIGVKVCDIEAPNVISLSSLVGNNAFFVQYEGVAEFNCVILNRWGNKIYEYSDPAGKWDGKTQGGTLVEEGTYFYIIKATFEGGEEVTKQGFVQVRY